MLLERVSLRAVNKTKLGYLIAYSTSSSSGSGSGSNSNSCTSKVVYLHEQR